MGTRGGRGQEPFQQLAGVCQNTREITFSWTWRPREAVPTLNEEDTLHDRTLQSPNIVIEGNYIYITSYGGHTHIPTFFGTPNSGFPLQTITGEVSDTFPVITDGGTIKKDLAPTVDVEDLYCLAPLTPVTRGICWAPLEGNGTRVYLAPAAD